VAVAEVDMVDCLSMGMQDQDCARFVELENRCIVRVSMLSSSPSWRMCFTVVSFD
jgi:hypothetical protein